MLGDDQVGRAVAAQPARSKPLRAMLSRAKASAGPDESTLSTCLAPPASAATLKPPV